MVRKWMAFVGTTGLVGTPELFEMVLQQTVSKQISGFCLFRRFAGIPCRVLLWSIQELLLTSFADMEDDLRYEEWTG